MATSAYTKTFVAHFSRAATLNIRSSLVLQHNPGLKKKKKVILDPKKLAKQKERMELKRRKEAVMIPVDPDSLPDPSWYDSDRKRAVPELSEEEKERRILMQKEWTSYTMKKHVADVRMLQDKIKCRENALRELRKVSELLYQEAIKIDKDVYPMCIQGPVETPAQDGYEPPDFDDSKK